MFEETLAAKWNANLGLKIIAISAYHMLILVVSASKMACMQL